MSLEMDVLVLRVSSYYTNRAPEMPADCVTELRAVLMAVNSIA